MRAFRAWLDEQHVAQRLLALVDGERRLTNLLHLAELLQSESLQRPGLEQLLAWFNAQRSAEAHGEDALLRLESDAERVQIVTIHTSKGLEYPLVFCPYLWDGALLRQHEDISCHADDGTPLLDSGQRAARRAPRARPPRALRRKTAPDLRGPDPRARSPVAALGAGGLQTEKGRHPRRQRSAQQRLGLAAARPRIAG
jgi:exodeoxyribonuclease V beta subunit